MILRVLLLLVLPVPLSAVVGRAALYWGGQAPTFYEFITLVGKGAFLFCGVHVLLIWPLHQFGKRDLSQMGSEVARVALCFFLIFLPLSSFVVLNSNLKTWVDLLEVLILVGPPVLIAALVFVSSGTPWLSSLVIALPLFCGLYLVSDIAGPFSTRIQYLSDGNSVLTFKIISSLSAIGFAFFKLGWKDRFASVADLLFALSLSVPAFYFAVPFLEKSLALKGVIPLRLTDLFWLGLFSVALIAKLRFRGGDAFVRIWALGLSCYAIFGCIKTLFIQDIGFSDFQRLAFYYLSIIFLTYLAFRPVAAKTSSWALTPVSES